MSTKLDVMVLPIHKISNHLIQVHQNSFILLFKKEFFGSINLAIGNEQLNDLNIEMLFEILLEYYLLDVVTIVCCTLVGCKERVHSSHHFHLNHLAHELNILTYMTP